MQIKPSLHFLPNEMSVTFFSLMKNLKSETMFKKNICFKGDTLKTTTVVSYTIWYSVGRIKYG